MAAGCDLPSHTMSHFFHSIAAKQTDQHCWTLGRPHCTGCAAVEHLVDVFVVFPLVCLMNLPQLSCLIMLIPGPELKDH